jgi:hypothetical protein
MVVAAARSGGNVSNERLGRWLRRIEGKIVNGFRLFQDGSNHGYPATSTVTIDNRICGNLFLSAVALLPLLALASSEHDVVMLTAPCPRFRQDPPHDTTAPATEVACFATPKSKVP